MKFMVQSAAGWRWRDPSGALRPRPAAWSLLLILIALSLTATTGIASAARVGHSSSSPKRGGTLTVTLNGATFPTMDPSVAASEANSGFIYYEAVYGALFQEDAAGNPVPDLLTGYHVSKDGLTYVLYVRKHVTFQDGTPFNAQAVEFNLDRDRNPANASLGLTYVQDISSISVPNAFTLVLHMSVAYPPLIAALATTPDTFMVSPTAFNSEGATNYGLHPVGAGPFKVVSYSPNISLDVVRYSGYWDQPEPYLNAVNFNFLNNSTTGYDTVLAAGKNGSQLDVGGATTPQTAKQARAAGGVQVWRPPATGEYFLHFNTFVPPFNNILAREAVAYATSNVQINKAVFLGLNRVVDAMGSPGALFYPSGQLSSYRTYDPSKAKQLVSQVPGGINFSIICVPCTYGYLTQAEALAQLYAQVGITMNVINLAEPAAVARFTSGDFQATMSSWTDIDPAIQMGEFVLPNATLNHGQSDPTLASMVNQAASNPNPAKRAALYLKIYNYINKEVYNLPTVTTSGYDIASENVKGTIASLPFPYLEQSWLSK